MASRREFLRGVVGGAGLLLGRDAGLAQGAADYSIEIAETSWEIAPKKVVRTAAYGGQVPGKLLRVREGQRVAVEIVNRLGQAGNRTGKGWPEVVHWHGQWIAPEVDGAMEEGTPMIPAGGRTRVEFVARPSGMHWYHTHSGAGRNLKRGLYSGQFGVLYVEPKENAGAYDREEFVVLHEWEPYFVASDDGAQEIQYRYGSVNGRMLGAGEPIRVKAGEKVLFHVLNASATLTHWLALPGHSFQVVALDGRPVPTQAKVSALRLGPAERVSAIVEMNTPGVWVMGEADAALRRVGMGVVVEYAGASGAPKWMEPASLAWDYAAFADAEVREAAADVVVPMIFTSKFEGHGALNRWMVNGKSFPDDTGLRLLRGKRNRLVFDNQSVDDHPVHLHRHAFELRKVDGKAVSGVFKDVVIVKARSKVEVDVVAENPGATLFHCHQQDHMDMGFMALFQYA